MNQRQDGGATPGAGDEGERGGRRLDLSLPQVAGSAVAAIAAAVLASQLGVYGTIIGAGVVSVIATCGASVFQHLFRRTGEQIRVVTVQAKPKGRQVPVRDAGSGPVTLAEAPDGEFGEATTHGTRVRGWKRPVIAAAVVFLVAMIGITGFELVSGQDLSGGKGTTVGSVVGGSGGGGGGGQPSEPSPRPGDTQRSQDPGQDPGGAPGDDGTTQVTPSPGDSPSSGDGGQQVGPSRSPGTPQPSPSDSAPTPSAPAPTPSQGDGGAATSETGTGTSGQ
ncbi:hypothetical protein HY68_00675 [Streptomyces sp. AcH 505]|nr:hypothetical protein HY68_00675 [Streptomyces sp. AcH 505]